MRITSLCLLVVLVSGCISAPVRVSEAEQGSLLSPIAHKTDQAFDAQVNVVRDTGLSAALLDFTIFLDGNLIGVLKPGQKVSFTLPAGNYVLGAGCRPCNDDFRIETIFIAVPGKQHDFRVRFLNGLELQPSTQLR